jgi:hypothetical protein
MWRIVNHLWPFLDSFARLRKWKQNRPKGGVAKAGTDPALERFPPQLGGIARHGIALARRHSITDSCVNMILCHYLGEDPLFGTKIRVAKRLGRQFEQQKVRQRA